MENPQIQLIKRQESYDIVITDELERKIRFLCDKLPGNEYSGTLFYTIEGSFKDKDLKIIAKDFFLQDVGEAAYTEFQNDVELAGYMASHELWDCYTGLMHSHNRMSTFFSGTDVATLRSEGNDNNHFVSLIINNAGVYSAAITRKVSSKVSGTKVIAYNSFDDVHVEEASMEFTRDESYIEYYPLNVIMPEAVPKSELELRLEEVRKNARSFINRKYSNSAHTPFNNPNIIPLGATSSIDKVKASDSEPKESEGKQLQLFTDKEMGKEVEVEETEEIVDIPYDKVHINPNIVFDSVTQIITGDLFSTYKQNIDINKWATNMEGLYTKRFGSPDNDDFKYWVDNLLDFLAGEVHDSKLIENGEDYMWAIWAYDVMVELEKFPKNKYLEVFSKSLERWLI